MRAGQELEASRTFERESRSKTWYHIDHKLRMFPVFELGRGDVKRRAANFSQLHVAATDAELSERKAHGRTALTAATGLIKHKRAVGGLELFNEPQSRFRGDDLRRRFHI